MVRENAREAIHKSDSPDAKYTVGAALLAKIGKVYLGANIENASF